jgi:predicted metal-binding protein
MQTEIGECTDEAGRNVKYERCRRVVPLSAFKHGDRFKALCEGCPKQGNNLSCPPHSPSFLEHVGRATEALVFCIRLPQEYFAKLPPQDRYHACFRQASRLLLDELRTYRDEGHPVGGSGPCMACETCSLEEGHEMCRNPEERTYSLESLGADVVGLLKTSFDIELEWSTAEKTSEYVCAVGAAFLP